MIYHIKIKGELDQSWSNWLGKLEITSNLMEDGSVITLLSVNVMDQPALFGVLDHIRDLNLALLSVELCENDKEKTT